MFVHQSNVHAQRNLQHQANKPKPADTNQQRIPVAVSDTNTSANQSDSSQRDAVKTQAPIVRRLTNNSLSDSDSASPTPSTSNSQPLQRPIDDNAVPAGNQSFLVQDHQTKPHI